MSGELKPCPFCGNRGAHEKSCYINLFFESEVLDADIPWEVMAIAWNQRAERTCHGIPYKGELKCSVCDAVWEYKYDYCPDCGSKVVELE